jgi:hypothetical protein
VNVLKGRSRHLFERNGQRFGERGAGGLRRRQLCEGRWVHLCWSVAGEGPNNQHKVVGELGTGSSFQHATSWSEW